MTNRLVVGAAVVDSLQRPRRLLAARRTSPPALAGLWEFPGGKVDQGETPEQALHRELAEELGVRVRLGPEVLDRRFGAGRDDAFAGDASASAAGLRAGQCVLDPDHGPVWPLTDGLVMRLWLAELVDVAEPRTLQPLDDHDQLRWLEAGTLLDVPWLPADAAAVRHLSAVLSGAPAQGPGD